MDDFALLDAWNRARPRPEPAGRDGCDASRRKHPGSEPPDTWPSARAPPPLLALLAPRLRRHDLGVLRLRVVSSSEPALVGRAFVVDREGLRVGRAPDNDIVLDEPGLSRHHATLQRAPSGWRLVDAGSANGLWVAGARVGSVELGPGVEVRIGGTVLALEDSGTASTVLLDARGHPLAMPGPSAAAAPLVTPGQPIAAAPLATPVQPIAAATLATPALPVSVPATAVPPPVVTPAARGPRRDEGSSPPGAIVIVAVLLVLTGLGIGVSMLALPHWWWRPPSATASAPASAPAPPDAKTEPAPSPAPTAPVPTGKEVDAPTDVVLADVREGREAAIDGAAGGELVLSDGARLVIDAGSYVGEHTLRLVRSGARARAKAAGALGQLYTIVADDQVVPKIPPRLEIPIDRAAFPDHKGAFAVYAIHGDGLPQPIDATLDVARDAFVIDGAAVQAPGIRLRRDGPPIGVAPPAADPPAPASATGVTTAPAKTTKVPCGQPGSVHEKPGQVFRIYTDVVAPCAHMAEVADILQESFESYQAAFKRTDGAGPFDGWLTPKKRMNVTLYNKSKDFPEGEYHPYWGNGSMSSWSVTSSRDAEYLPELRVTLFHEMFHAVQDRYSVMYVSGMTGRQWWMESTAEWAGRRYSQTRPLDADAMMTMFVKTGMRKANGTPYLLRFPIDESRSWRGKLAAYHYALMIEHIEQLGPGYVRKALNGEDVRGETLLEAMYKAGKIDTTYPDLAERVLVLGGYEASLDGKIMETKRQTRVWRRTGDAHDAELGPPEAFTTYEQRFVRRTFTASMASATARFFHVIAHADAKPDVGLGVAVLRGGVPVDHGLILTSAGATRLNASYDNHIKKLATAGDIWIVVFRPWTAGEDRDEQDTQLHLSLYLDCPRPGGVMIGSGGTRRSRQTIDHEECYRRNGYEQRKQADGTLRWVDIEGS